LKSLTITRVIVAHRRETIAAADRVITIDHGTVVSERRNIHIRADTLNDGVEAVVSLR
jgi:ABC-type bacteriocin/lantibiotic exporter with double-glycine peptidase domain